MKIIDHSLRAVIERVTEIEVLLYGVNTRLYVFENLNERGIPCTYWVQNWECDDITNDIPNDTHTMIKNMLKEHYSSQSNINHN